MRVYIRPLTIEDADISYKWRNDPEIWKYTGTRPDRVISREIEREWAQKVLKNKDQYRFAIMVNDNARDVYVGNIHLSDVNLQNKSGNYHIFIGDKYYWGKGIATKATEKILEFALKKLGLQSVFLEVAMSNLGAIQVYRKCGFVEIPDSKHWDTKSNLYRIRMSISLK